MKERQKTQQMEEYIFTEIVHKTNKIVKGILYISSEKHKRIL